MALMEKNTRKRQRFESPEYSTQQSTCVESEENPSKRVCEVSYSGNVEVLCEIMSEEVDYLQESSHEELVWNMMKELEEEIVSCSVQEEASVNQCGSDILRENGDEAESTSRENSTQLEQEYNIFDGDVKDLLWACHEMDNLESFQDYWFFECLEMERDAEYQLLLEKWLCDNCSEGRDLISVNDFGLFSN